MNARSADIAFEVNGAPVSRIRPSRHAAFGGAARSSSADRHQGRLRRRRLRRLHRAARRRAGLRLPRAGRRRVAGSCGAHGRGPCQRKTVGAAGVLPRAWRGAMRHLHAGPAGRRDRAAGDNSAARRNRGQGRAWRRPLPLHRLPQDHRGGDGRLAPRGRPRRPAARNGQGRRRVADPARRRRQGDGRGKIRRRQLSGRCARRAGRALAALSRALRLRRSRRLCPKATPASSASSRPPTFPARTASA